MPEIVKSQVWGALHCFTQGWFQDNFQTMFDGGFSVVAGSIMVIPQPKMNVNNSDGYFFPTVSGTGRWAGIGSAWGQGKPEARKMIKTDEESHLSSTRFVGRRLRNKATPVTLNINAPNR